MSLRTIGCFLFHLATRHRAPQKRRASRPSLREHVNSFPQFSHFFVISYPRRATILRVFYAYAKLLILVASLFTTPALFAQGVSYTGTPIALTRGGFPAAGATVTVCLGNVAVTLTASPPCAPYASIFSDPVLATPITQPGFKTDGLGNYPFYVAGGATYTIVLTGSGFSGASTVWNSPLGVTNSPLTVKSLNVSTIFADSLTPSALLCSVTGSDASAKIQCAINLLPANGGVISGINLTDIGGTGSTVIDPGAKSVSLYLGPYTYQIQQLVLETNFRVFGLGFGSFSASSTSTTVLQACATCAAINTVVLGTNGGNGGPVQHASIDGLRIYGATADTAIGMNLKTVNGAGTGIWYSTFSNMCVGACGPSGASANGFTGGAIILDATGANTINQFLDFINVSAVKTNGGGPALSLLGTNGQMNFIQCPFDGTTRNDGTNVVQIANSAGNGGPYSLVFSGCTVQHGTNGFNIAGAFSITISGTHFELVGVAISPNQGVASEISAGIIVSGSTCQNACGNNTGAGAFAKTTTPNSVTIKFIGNQIQNSVDANYVGFTNIQNFISIGDESDTLTTTVPLANLFGQQITYKVGSAAGDYTTASTNYVAVDGTNLAASIFIPTGWKLVVSASGAIQSDTAAAQVFTAIADAATPVVVNTSLASAASLPINFSLNTVIAGNGATHSIDLRYKTAVGADAAHIINTAANGIPQMVLTLMPSN